MACCVIVTFYTPDNMIFIFKPPQKLTNP